MSGRSDEEREVARAKIAREEAAIRGLADGCGTFVEWIARLVGAALLAFLLFLVFAKAGLVPGLLLAILVVLCVIAARMNR